MKNEKKPIALLILMGITAVGITVSGIVFEQSFWRMLPLYVSLIIGLLQSSVNRYASLIGAVNSLLYTAVYFYYGLYAMALYALLISAPLQLVTFIRWQKSAYEKTTVFRKLSAKQRVMVSGGFIGCWILLYIIFSALGSSYLLLDNTLTLLGILCTVITIFAYIEYTLIKVLSDICSLALYIAMILTTPEQTTYLIFTVYSTICGVIAIRRAWATYKKQEAERKQTETADKSEALLR